MTQDIESVEATALNAQHTSHEPAEPVADDIAQPVVLAASTMGKSILVVAGVLAFALGFVGHQWWLGDSQRSVKVAAVAASPVDTTRAEAAYSRGPAQVGDIATEVAARPTAQPQSAMRTGSAHTVTRASSAPLAQTIATTDTHELASPDWVPAQAPAAGPQALAQTRRVSSLVEARDAQARELRRLQLALLHQKAEAALAKDRLTTPLSDSAVFYYREMLALDEHNPVAKAGLLRVAERYREFHRRLLARGDQRGAQDMLLQAQALAPEAGFVAALEGEAPTVIAQPRSAPAPISSAPVKAGGVVQSDSARRVQVLQLARQALHQGRPQDAITLLSNELPQASTDGELVELLHQAYVNAGHLSDAVNLRITLRGAVAGYRLARMHSSELLQQGQVGEAINVLERQLPEYEEDGGYYGLLAGLYYKAARYQDAAQAYEKLLALNPDLGSYWLGYAVALDAQGDARALQAFQRAAQTLSSNDAAREYVLQRVRELGRG